MASDTNWFFVITLIFLVTTIMIPLINDTFNKDFKDDLDFYKLDFIYFEMDIYERGWFTTTYLDTIIASLNVEPEEPIDTYEDLNVRIGIDLNQNVLSFEGIEGVGRYRAEVTMSYFSEEELMTVVYTDKFNIDVQDSFGLFGFVLNKGEVIFDRRNQGISKVSMAPGQSFSIPLEVYSDTPGVFNTIKTATYNIADEVTERTPGGGLFKLYVEGIKGMPMIFNVFYFGLLGYMVTFIIARYIRGQ